MIPFLQLWQKWQQRKPRASGDDPKTLVPSLKNLK